MKEVNVIINEETEFRPIVGVIEIIEDTILIPVQT